MTKQKEIKDRILEVEKLLNKLWKDNGHALEIRLPPLMKAGHQPYLTSEGYDGWHASDGSCHSVEFEEE